MLIKHVRFLSSSNVLMSLLSVQPLAFFRDGIWYDLPLQRLEVQYLWCT